MANIEETTEEKRARLEEHIKFIFFKPRLDDRDVIIGTRLIREWKSLTNWQSDNTPALRSEDYHRINKYEGYKIKTTKQTIAS